MLVSACIRKGLGLKAQRVAVVGGKRATSSSLRSSGLGDAGPAGTGPGITIQDVNGTVVGSVLDPGGFAYDHFEVGSASLTIARNVGNNTVAFHVTRSGVNSDALFFASSDCTGTPLLLSAAYPTVEAGAFIVPGMAHSEADKLTLFFPAASPAPITFNSRLYFIPATECVIPPGQFTPPDRCCYPESNTAAFAATASVELPPVVAPFRAGAP